MKRCECLVIFIFIITVLGSAWHKLLKLDIPEEEPIRQVDPVVVKPQLPKPPVEKSQPPKPKHPPIKLPVPLPSVFLFCVSLLSSRLALMVTRYASCARRERDSGKK